MSRREPSLVFTLLLIAGRAPAQDQRAALLHAEQTASRASADSGCAEMLAGRLGPNGVLLWPGAPVLTGRDQVKRLFVSLRESDPLRLSWQPLDLTMARDSSLGVVWGVVALSSGSMPGGVQFGRYISVWRREPPGWRIEAIMFSGVSPAARAIPAGVSPSRPPRAAAGPEAPFVTADLAFARLAGDSGAAVAFQRWAAPDATVFGEHGLLTRGPEAIGRGVAGAGRWRWYPVAAGASNPGDLGWTVGQAVISPEQGEPVYSKYLTVWIRRSGGPPRFLTDGGNRRPAGEATTPGTQGPGSAPQSPH